MGGRENGRTASRGAGTSCRGEGAQTGRVGKNYECLPRPSSPFLGAGTKNITAGTKNMNAGTKNIVAGTKNIIAGTKNITAGTKNITAGTKNIIAGTKI